MCLFMYDLIMQYNMKIYPLHNIYVKICINRKKEEGNI